MISSEYSNSCSYILSCFQNASYLVTFLSEVLTYGTEVDVYLSYLSDLTSAHASQILKKWAPLLKNQEDAQDNFSRSFREKQAN